jgi:nicotinate-nucleotide adenylyltransferase
MIGILGGTFDPVHFGHLRPALDVLESLGLSEMRFIPLNAAVHRPQPVASGRQRLAMLRAALNGQSDFVTDERELRRAGGSYTHDTLHSQRTEIGPEAPICLLVGADAFRQFLTWHRPDAISELAHLVVIDRPGTRPGEDPELSSWLARRLTSDPAHLARNPGGRVLFQRVTQLGISATAIRQLVARGRSPRYLLPDSVLAIIEREGFYRGPRST